MTTSPVFRMSAASSNVKPLPQWRSPYPAAREAHKEWASLEIVERVARLQPAAAYVDERIEELATLIHDENGKPRVEAIGHELLPTIAYVRWLEAEAHEILGPRARPLTWLPNRRCMISRRPFGTILVIAPWNIPFLIPFSQVLAALAAGNAVVLKPSEVTPRVAEAIREALAACDLPEGLFSLVQGDGAVGAKLIEERPDKVVFTGSVATGRKVMAACAAHPIPVELELGGIDAAVVLEDADLEYAASAIAWGATFNHGQVCASVERLLVHESVHAELIDRVADKMERANPYDDLSRVTFEGQKRVIDRHIENARELGLKPRTGGSWLSTEKLRPTLYDGPEVAGSLAWNEETFGPVLAALPFRDDDHAVELHNDTRFGLTASVFSRDLDRASRLAGRLNAGNVAVNDLGALHYSQPELPWGGVGESGFGRSHGEEGLLGMTWPQVVDTSKLGAVEPKRPWFYPYDHHLEDMLAAFAHAIAARSPARRAYWLGKTAGRLGKVLTGKGRI